MELNVKTNGQTKSLALTAEYVETLKYTIWLRKFLDIRNPKTFGNAAQLAIEAYGYDPAEQYKLATVTGTRNRKKSNDMIEGMLEKMGFGFGDILRIGIKKMMEGDYDDWRQFVQDIGLLKFENYKEMAKERAIREEEKKQADVHAKIQNWIKEVTI